MVVKAGALALTFVLLAACSPKLNWRTVQSPDQHYTALFPGKPEKINRQTTYQDQGLAQTLEALKIDDDIYSISTIKLTNKQAALTPSIVAQLQANLLERAKAEGGLVVAEDGVYQTTNHQLLPIKDHLISFVENGKVQQTMRVRWITRLSDSGAMFVYQISVLHTNRDSIDAKLLLTKEEYANFFNEFYPE
ncbi:hypothetical protein [Polynucleobacter necessarius]|uniref:hypothetical protein n=1 Tax=Polynucleobacter necessarius TaxID=576610 RepID=UPI001E3BFFEB|nr:hypothetical protein [Polynucleobacter necessarius]